MSYTNLESSTEQEYVRMSWRAMKNRSIYYVIESGNAKRVRSTHDDDQSTVSAENEPLGGRIIFHGRESIIEAMRHGSHQGMIRVK